MVKRSTPGVTATAAGSAENTLVPKRRSFSALPLELAEAEREIVPTARPSCQCGDTNRE